MRKLIIPVSRKASLIFLIFTIIFASFLVSGCGVNNTDQEKALNIIHDAEPDFEQLAQDAIRNDGSFKETDRGSFGWKFDRKSISHQIFARYGYWSNDPQWLMFIGNILEAIFGINPWPSDKGIYIGLTVDLDAGTVRLMTETERWYWDK